MAQTYYYFFHKFTEVYFLETYFSLRIVLLRFQLDIVKGDYTWF